MFWPRFLCRVGGAKTGFAGEDPGMTRGAWLGACFPRLGRVGDRRPGSRLLLECRGWLSQGGPGRATRRRCAGQEDAALGHGGSTGTVPSHSADPAEAVPKGPVRMAGRAAPVEAGETGVVERGRSSRFRGIQASVARLTRLSVHYASKCQKQLGPRVAVAQVALSARAPELWLSVAGKRLPVSRTCIAPDRFVAEPTSARVSWLRQVLGSIDQTTHDRESVSSGRTSATLKKRRHRGRNDPDLRQRAV